MAKPKREVRETVKGTVCIIAGWAYLRQNELEPIRLGSQWKDGDRVRVTIELLRPAKRSSKRRR